MEAKTLISIMLVLNSFNLSIAQKPGPHQQSFKCSTKGDLKSDIHLSFRDIAFDYLDEYIGSPNKYTGYNFAYIFNNHSEIWATSLCPPNIKMEACRECANNTISYLIKNCPKQKEAVAWTALPSLNCMVRYEDYMSKKTLFDWARTSFSSPPNETSANAGELEKGLKNLADKLTVAAAEGGNVTKFRPGSIAYGPGSQTLWGSMQCTPDISEKDCIKCLSDATIEIHNCCSRERKLSGISMSTNCYFWYAHHNFLDV